MFSLSSEYKNPVEYYSIENARVIDIQKEAEENLKYLQMSYKNMLSISVEFFKS
jgi:hypothetical protein